MTEHAFDFKDHGMSIVSFLGIYPMSIIRADVICRITLKNEGFSDDLIDDFYKKIYEKVCDMGDFHEINITDSIISIMFNELKVMLNEKFDNLNFQLHIDDWNSYILINGVESKEFDFSKVDKCHLD